MIDYDSIVRLVLKLFGVVLIVNGAVSLVSYLPSLFSIQDPGEVGAVLMYLMPLIAPFLFGTLLWFFPATITNTVVRFDVSVRETKIGWAQELERVGVSLLGLYLFYDAVSDIAYHVLNHRAKAAMLGNVRAPDDFPALIAAVTTEFVLALLFMLQSKGIVNLLRKARGS